MRYFVNQVLIAGGNKLTVECRSNGAPESQVTLYLNDQPATFDEVIAVGFIPSPFNNFAWQWIPTTTQQKEPHQ